MIGKKSAFTLLLVAAALMFWHLRVTGTLPLDVVGISLGFTFLCAAYGQVAVAATSWLLGLRLGTAFCLLSGFFVFNTLLFILTLASPLGMHGNILTLAVVGILLAGFRWKLQWQARWQSPLQPRLQALLQPQWRSLALPPELPEFLAVLVSVIAATLWCTDAQTPIIQGQQVVYQVWQDVFIHVREISVFAQAHGIGTIQDIKLAGAPAPIYHVASYMSAAAVSALGQVPAMAAYSSFQLPFGIVLTGLAAYCLATSVWGPGPGLAAAVAILLVPDAYRQGFGNRYLSYHFLAQVNLGMLYGIACAAMAWVFMLSSCRGRPHHWLAAIVASYCILALTLFYKAHVFVANALLLLIYPCLFLADLKLRWRVILGIIVTALFVGVVHLSQTVARIPVLRLDGSGIGAYLITLVEDYDNGILKDYFDRVLIIGKHPKWQEALNATALLLLSTFGFWLIIMPAVFIAGRKRLSRAVLAFPLLITANYLVMSMGLAMDRRNVGTPDELLNRPMVWAYFAVAAWTAGAGYFLAIGSRLPQRPATRTTAAALACVLLIITAVVARNLQTFPMRRGMAAYDQFNAVPMCLTQAAAYLRNNSAPAAIIQDAANDPRFVVTALAERQMLALDSTFGGKSREHQQQLDRLERLLRIDNAEMLDAATAALGISWYLLRPETRVSWPAEVLQRAVFECNGYRIFRFRDS